MGELVLNIDTARFNAALDAFAANSKRDMATILKEQARGFVRRAIDLTPPAKGKADTNARKRGEAAVVADLHRIFVGQDRSFLEYLQQVAGTDKIVANTLRKKDGTPYLVDYDLILWGRESMVPFHEAHRSKQTGRVFKVNRDATTGRRRVDQGRGDIAFVPKDNLAWFEKRVKGRVGVLPSGWNKAAGQLGVRVPSWIKRHGEGRGDIHIDLSSGQMTITVTNDVAFVGAVKGFAPRIQRALNDQARAMERRVEFFKEKGGRQAGLK